MGAMKRLSDDLKDGSVLVEVDEFFDSEAGAVRGLIQVTTALGYIKISGHGLLVRAVDIDDIAIDGLEAFPGIDDLKPPSCVTVVHNSKVLEARQ